MLTEAFGHEARFLSLQYSSNGPALELDTLLGLF